MLFLQTAAIVESFKGSDPSGQFRDHMTQGMEYGAHGKHQIEFYEAVVTEDKVWNNSCMIQASSSCNVKVGREHIFNTFWPAVFTSR